MALDIQDFNFYLDLFLIDLSTYCAPPSQINVSAKWESLSSTVNRKPGIDRLTTKRIVLKHFRCLAAGTDSDCIRQTTGKQNAFTSK